MEEGNNDHVTTLEQVAAGEVRALLLLFCISPENVANQSPEAAVAGSSKLDKRAMWAWAA